MTTKKFEDPKNSLILFGLKEKLNFLINLYNSNKLPKVLMLSGKKGIGKFTLINHLLAYIFDKVNYNFDNNIIDSNSKYYKEYFNNIFPNIIYLSGSMYENVKVENIRELKSSILKSSISKNKRFIILDDVELFNNNSLNALLKIIEEPSLSNNFIFINNKAKPLLDTIYSRSLELKILLTKNNSIKIIKSLIDKNNLNNHIDYETINLSPGNFIIFNDICENFNIDVNDNLLINLESILKLYKKNKNFNFIAFIFYIIDLHFMNLILKKTYNIEKINESKSLITNNINNFLKFNLNQNALINAINTELLHA